jgi:bifunctional DNA-binding transcriptional regulator/antitoxin component of YhaV-PrlF toxin-antitoxin module
MEAVMAVNLATTRMSSKGQVVIPEALRHELGLATGAQFLVLGHGDTVMLKVIHAPSEDEFNAALKRVRQKAKAVGRKRSDIAKVIADVRSRK